MSFSNNYGLNPDYNYYEFSFDSSEATRSYNEGVATTDHPVFFLSAKQELTNIAAVKILEVQVPYSYYVFTAPAGGPGNGFIQYSDPLGNASFNLTGSFTQAQLLVELKSKLDAAHVALGGNPNAFTVSYLDTSGKFTFLGFDGGPLVFTLTFPAGTSADLLGFTQGSHTADLSGSLIAPNVAIITGPNYLYLNSRTLGPLVNLYLSSSGSDIGGNAGPQVAKIPVNVEPFGVIYWQDPDPQKWFDIENLSQLQQIDFYFSTGTSPLVTKFNGLSFSIKFGILLNKANRSKPEPASEVQFKRPRGFFDTAAGF